MAYVSPRDIRVEWDSLQAEESLIGSDAVKTTTDQETVGFVDAGDTYSYAIPSSTEELAVASAMDKVTLAEFLSRPVKIWSKTWTVADSAAANVSSFNPWNLFFSDARIKYKLNNWAFIRCNLKVRFLINASPFYYGAAMVTYAPCANMVQSIASDGMKELINYSQRPRVMIYPQMNEGAEITLPFFWPAQYVRCAVAQDFTDLGIMHLHYATQLQSATGVTGAGITIQAYAWAEDVTLCGPTASLALQAKDEYAPNGIISAPASAIASAASKLNKVPIIGKYARATEIGANAVSQIAKMFGFTDVPQIGDVQGVQTRAVPPLASTEIGFPTEKLTVDAKNELTIDPSAVGLASTDELAVANIAQKESYLTKFSWSTGDASSSLLFNMGVAPSLMYNATAVPETVYMTPLAWLSTMHSFWRGDIIVRLRFLATQYHKGRVRISYDPTGAIYNDPVSESVVMTKIVDLDKETDVELRIPFSQHVAWCRNILGASMNTTNIKWGTSATNFHIDGITNGCITVRVSNALSAPVASSTIHCLVFVRGADNMEFAAPSLDGTDRLTTFPLQMEESVINEGEGNGQQLIPGKLVSPTDHLYLTYMGEAVRSLRTSMRRKCLWYTWSPRPGTGQFSLSYLKLYRMPFTFGYDPYGLGAAKGVITTATYFPYNWTQNNFLTYVSGAFVGNRGSVNYIFYPVSGGAGGNIAGWVRAYRKPTNTTMGAANTTVSAPPNVDMHYWAAMNNGTAGQSLGTYVNNVLNISVPMYSQNKFQPCLPGVASNSSDPLHEIYSNIEAELFSGTSVGVDSTNIRVPIFTSAGTDYTCLFFLNVPVYSALTVLPAP